MSKTKILIVEDSGITLDYLHQLFENHGYHVIGKVRSGEAAVDFVEQEVPDLIIMDIDLQGKMNGIEATRIIRSKNQVAIIFISQIQDDEVWKKAKLTKPVAQLTKPLDEGVLLRTVSDAFQDAIAAEINLTHGGLEDYFPFEDRIFVKTKLDKGKFTFRRYRYDEVLFLQAKERYADIVVLSDGEKGFTTYATSSSLKNLTELLPSSIFMRVHKSYTINLKKVTKYSDEWLILEANRGVPVGDGYKNELLKRLGLN